MTVSSPGRYSALQLPIDDYHSQCTDHPSISASGLKMILECPAKFWAFSDLNPARFARKESKALDIGKAAHSLVLGEPEFHKYFIISPFADFRKTEAQEWRDAQTKTILRSDEFDAVLAMANAQRASSAVMNAFVDGEPEVSLVFIDAETGIDVKSRPDWLPHDPARRVLADYKTCLTIEPRRLSADAFKYGYQIQAALQVDAVKSVLGIESAGIAHIVQEKDPPYLADLRMFTAEQIEFGRILYRKALRIFAECLNTGKWPAYTVQGSYFETPFYIAKLMEAHNGKHEYTTEELAAAASGDWLT